MQQSPLRTRDILYRGRTEGMRLHCKARENETIQYFNVMRLYAYICKYFKFPVGHPIIRVGDACKGIEACLGMDGLIKSSNVPPEMFYHPILPFRCNNILMFCLCRTCVLTSSEECIHTRDEDRALTGTWVMDEVRLTIEKGYRILEIYEVYENLVTKYNPETGEGELFVAYVNTFLILNAEIAVIPAKSTVPKTRTEMWTRFARAKGEA